MQMIELDVQGMSCGACVGHVTRALQTLSGVQSARVNLEEQQALVSFDPAQVTVDQMIAAVDDEGYKAAARA